MQQSGMAGSWTESEMSTSRLLSPVTALSFVVPVMNEERNVRPLYEKLAAKMAQLGMRVEVVFIDDGSTDQTFFELQKLHQEHPQTVEIIRFRRNFGKTPALVAGFSHCRGDVVFTMDGDLQDDPEEIPRFLEKLDEGYDLVTGWKFPRLDPITKTFPSRIFNGLVSSVTGLHLHDINCGFKAYRREVLEDIHLKLYGEFHRFVPVIAHWRGFRVAEIKVRHHPRVSGVSKFGGKRFVRGLIDLMTILFLTSSLHTPLRLFSKLGFWTFTAGVLAGAFVLVRRFASGEPIHTQPLIFVSMLLLIFGFLFLLIGLIAEMIRYYAFEPGEEYSIKQEIMRSSDSEQQVSPVPMPPIPAAFQQESISSETTGSIPNSSQSSGDWGEFLQPGWDKSASGKHMVYNRSVPRRSNIVPM